MDRKCGQSRQANSNCHKVVSVAMNFTKLDFVQLTNAVHTSTRRFKSIGASLRWGVYRVDIG